MTMLDAGYGALPLDRLEAGLVRLIELRRTSPPSKQLTDEEGEQ